MQPFGTILLLLLASAALVLLGHVFRLLRWEQFIRIYEYPQRRSLLRAMAGGYAVNFLLPFHVGDFLRAALAGRKMKTGTGFAFATVIMDRFLDVAQLSHSGKSGVRRDRRAGYRLLPHSRRLYMAYHGMERTRDCDSPAYLGKKRGKRMGFIPVIPSTSRPDASQLLYRRGR